MKRGKKVFVGVSGGVDSSVSLLRLKEAGHDVTAVFIKTWQPDFTPCTWKDDRLDAMRISASLSVPFLTFDAETAYRDMVAEYMINEYREGRTPNPDVMCNEHVKFGVFYDFACAHGADYVATGHYAQVLTAQSGQMELHRGIDTNKDQSYFLWRIKRNQLEHILFPVGALKKPEVRKEAESANLKTQDKKDSQGVCFLGEIDMKDFLSHYIDISEGLVRDASGKDIGRHDGVVFYTVGQRHGFTITTGQDAEKPYYVISKEIETNTLIVDHAPRTCTNSTVTLGSVNLLVDSLPEFMEAQFRYRQKPFRVQRIKSDAGHAMLKVLDTNIESPSIGQSCVLYSGTHCLGGGIINMVI
jgi:tRNA-specific 2-thiouridylase